MGIPACAVRLNQSLGQMVEEAIKEYDNTQCIAEKDSDRTDFLALFRKEGEKSPESMPHRDLMNHLMNNL